MVGRLAEEHWNFLEDYADLCKKYRLCVSVDVQDEAVIVEFYEEHIDELKADYKETFED